MSSPTHGSSEAQAAHDHIVRVINDAWLALALSLGERLGLTEALAQRDSVEAAQLAASTGLGGSVRYVEDWLWTLAAGGIVAIAGSDESPRFTLRPGYAEVMTSRGSAAHWSRIAEQIVAMATLEESLVAAIRQGGGLPASAYEGRIVEVLSLESGPIFEAALLQEVLPAIGVVDALAEGIDVLDAGCGDGSALTILAERFPRARFAGVDQSADAISHARARAEETALDNIVYEVADLEEPWTSPVLGAGYDLIMAANVAHDLSDPAAFFERCRERLRPGGTLYLHELAFTEDMRVNITHPHAIGVLVFGLYHCLPLASRRPGLAPGGMWGTAAYLAALAAAGFTDVRVLRAPSDPSNETIVARAPGNSPQHV